ncbi:hypothetical protein [Streptomyces sp. NPDC008139]|uniref:hypothetical protein n=1 Tax=Streptomyces sp. NPDC008139 TaxID=3364814 RepID=UPI0036E0170D
MAANARLLPPGTDRTASLDAVARQRADLDPPEYPFLGRAASRLATTTTASSS